MPKDPWPQNTSKVSEIHREIICSNLIRRYARLLKLRIRALQHATPNVVWFTALIIPLPTPSDTEQEELRDDVKREDFPWLDARRRVVLAEEDGDNDYSGENEEKDGEKEAEKGSRAKRRKRQGEMQTEVPIPPFQFCRKRIEWELAVNRQILKLERDSKADDLGPWRKTYPGLLESFLDHLNGHCCPPGAWLLTTSGGAATRHDDPERHVVCVGVIHMDRLQEEINFVEAFMSETSLRNEMIRAKPGRAWSRWKRLHTPRSTAKLMRSYGLGSPLVEGRGPDDMGEYNCRTEDKTMYKCWESWVWDSWEEASSTVGTARPERRILVEDGTAPEKNAEERSENSCQQCMNH
ncbi:hypothetical protein E4U54_007491 [Claviceps lovelessii]|nr:hypothetical protein E4U54_007491 [Claviceps lovelessii]